MEQRKLRERSFHNTRFQKDGAFRRPADRFYAIAYGSSDAFRRRILENCRGKRVLEIGCGEGHYALELARAGAIVTGIDISEVAIENASDACRSCGVTNATFKVMDVEAMDFPAGYFDVACGSGILHHIDLRAALPEIARVLSPNGHGVFAEPLGHNPCINLYRRLTPSQRTSDEHPLTQNDIASMSGYFNRIDQQYFSLTSLAAVPLATARFMRSIVDRLDALDARLFYAFPALRKYAWYVVLDMRQPAAHTAQ